MVRFLVSCSAFALCLTTTQVQAQTVEGSQVTDAEGDGGLAEIIVTAQRRSESVQKSSLSIQVASAEDLQRAGVTSARDLATVVPNVQVTQAGPYVQTYIRGVGDYSAHGLAQLAVSYNIDGVNIDRAAAISPNFYDLERVEVLKGPQGTLYGRNATGGAVNLITVKPSQSFGGYITADYGNYDSKKLAGALNVPLSPTLAARAAFQIIDRDGYLSEGTDDSVQQAARLQLLWKPSGGVSLRLSGDYAHQGGRGAGAVLWPPQPGTRTRTSNTDPINSAVRSVSAFGIDTPLTPDSFLRNDLYNLAAELNVDLGDAATLTVIPAYRRGELTQRSYTIGSRFETPVSETDQTSLEVRLGNQSDRFKWVVGGFYFDLTGREVFKVNASPFIPGISVTADLRKFSTKSVAAFGEVTVSLTDQLRGIAGLRYTKEDKAIAGFYTDTSVVQAFNAAVDSKRSFNAVTWKFGAEYDVSPTSMLFATVAKGFKSGGFFLAPPPDNQFDAELLTDFSIGSRNRFFDNKLQVNASVFYWKYRDQQVSSVGFTNSFFLTFLTRNAGASNPYGADLDVVFRATPNDTLSASLAYIKAEYDKYDVNYPAFLPTPPTACKVNAPAGGLTPIDCSGFPLARTPEWSGSASYRHEFDFSDGSTVDANLGMTFASSRFLSVDFFTPDTKTGGYALVNADVTYHTPDKAFSVTAYMRNIGNKTVYVGSQTDLFGNGLSHRTLGAPRTYGISANYKF